MEAFEAGIESFVVSGKSSEASCPGEASLHDPPFWQQDEASFCHGMFDYFQLDAVLLGSLCGIGSGVALVDIG